MSADDLIARYNYDECVPEKFETQMSFDQTPALAEPAPNFPLWNLEDGSETDLATLWSANAYTVVEFGSFT